MEESLDNKYFFYSFYNSLLLIIKQALDDEPYDSNKKTLKPNPKKTEFYNNANKYNKLPNPIADFTNLFFYANYIFDKNSKSQISYMKICSLLFYIYNPFKSILRHRQ